MTFPAPTYPPVVVSGPSGVGKGTLIEMLIKRFPNDQFGFSVSHTTRAPRGGEVDGVHYNFTSVEEFQQNVVAGHFVEYAEVHGKYYGTSVAAVQSVQSTGKVCILDIDVQGVQNIKMTNLPCKYIFIAPPSIELLEARLRGRGTEKEEDIRTRLANAKAELAFGKGKGNFDVVLVNDDLKATFEMLCNVMMSWYPHLRTCIRPNPVVFCGPSGVGKGTLIKKLMERFPSHNFGFSVSHTTRQPREGEVDKEHYNFTTVEKFQKEVEEGKFLEYAEVHGNYYGTSIEAVESVREAGKVCILDIDVQGVRNVKKSSLNPYYVFIAPPSMESLEARLRGRGTEKEEDIKRRLENSLAELEYGNEAGNFDRVFINASLDACFQDMADQFKKWYPQLSEYAPDDGPAKNCTCVVS